ncbi:MAG: peptidoglycan-binding protein [Brevundimonas sp.]|uniref:peptidoglycan-binding protein n=1 Tax=Brevundimonas sp. TaxID=1871086 RepID=UPI002ABC7506|nr:peptidoglycan-binding protein [Brevundimonas sp.]MDZ4111880.1 peptidoglycan-binding protein [Brevundimonas sp.]
MADTTIDKARGLLTAPVRRASPWATLAAAALAATAAVLMAGVMVLGPGVRFEEPPVAQPLFPNG